MKQQKANEVMPVITVDDFKRMFSRDELMALAKDMGLDFSEQKTVLRDQQAQSYNATEAQQYKADFYIVTEASYKGQSQEAIAA